MSVIKLDLPLARVFAPILETEARYIGLEGGRGSGKSWTAASYVVEHLICNKDARWLAAREVQRNIKESSQKLITDTIKRCKAESLFIIQDAIIKRIGGDGSIGFIGLQDHTADRIKSYEGIDGVWVEEAQTLSAKSLEMLRPTIRKAGSKLLFTWNPRSASDAVDAFFHDNAESPDILHIKANYDANPWFSKELDAERALDLQNKPLRYGHIWLGQHEPAAIGAVWTRPMIEEHRAGAMTPQQVGEMMERVLVGVDPATSADGDKHGIVVVATDKAGHGYVLEDASMNGTPSEWARMAVAMLDRWGGTQIIAESNQGGEMVASTLKTVRPNLAVKLVRATKGKVARAEPIASLMATGRISHAGHFPELEDEMIQITSGGYTGSGSPDRTDAMVWGFTELFTAMIAPQRNTARPRKRARATIV